MAESFTDRLDLEAQAYIDKLNAVIASQQKWNQVIRRTTERLHEMEGIADGTVVQINEIDNAGKKLTATLVKEEGTWKKVGKAVIDLTGNYRELTEKQKEVMRLANEEERVSRRLNSVRREAERDITNAKNIENTRRKQVLADQARDASQRLGRNLQTQFVDPFRNVASPQQLLRVQNHINQVVGAVQKGAIGVREAQRIIDSAVAGKPQVLSGIAAQIQRNATSIVSGTQKMSRGFVDLAAATERANRVLTGFYGKLLGIQLLHTAIRSFLGALQQSIDTAKEFSIRIAEIQTISHGAGLSFTDWANKVRTLSDEFGNPILDVAEGTYEAISNQVAKGADATNFMAKALELARVTVASTADSVNALSSVINAYGKSTADVEQISAVLFKTVDLGRIRLSDMANTLGRISPLAANLGIEFEELQAAIATLTIVGISPDETLTALNAVMTKLLNPTKEMTRFLDSIGAASGQAAIGALGFEGVLRKLIESVDKGNFALDDLFNEIRATRGILPLKRGIEGYGKTLDAIRTGSLADFRQAQEEITASIGTKFEKELNRVRNFFSQDFGQNLIARILELGATFDESGKRVSGFVEEIKNLISIGTVLLKTYAAVRITMLGLNAGVALSNQAFNLLANQVATDSRLIGNLTKSVGTLQRAFAALASPIGILGLTAVAGVIFHFIESAKQEQRELADLINNIGTDSALEAEKLTKKFSEENTKRREDFRKTLTKQFNDYGKYVNSLNLLSQRLGKEQAKVIDANAKAIKNSFDIYTKDAQEFINEIERSLNQSVSNIEKAKARIQRIKDEMSTEAFAAELKLKAPVEQVNLIQGEIRRLTELANQIFTSTDPSELAAEATRREKIFERIGDLRVQLAERIAKAEEKVAEVREKSAELKERQAAQKGIGGKEDELQDLRRGQQVENTTAALRARGLNQARRERLERKRAQDEAKASGQDALELAQETEQERRGDVSLENLQKEESLAQAILTAAGAKSEFDKQGAELRQQELQIQQQLLALNEEAKKQKAEEAAFAKQQFEDLKDTFEAIAKFDSDSKLFDSLNPENVKEIQEMIRATFEKGIQSTDDPQILKQLIAQREALIAESDRRVNDKRLKLEADSLLKRRDALIKQQQEVSAAQEKGVTGRAEKLAEVDKTMLALMRAISGREVEPGGLEKGLLAQARIGLASGDPAQIAKARQQFDFMLDNMTKVAGGFDELKDKTVVQGNAFGEGKKTLEDLFFDMRKLLSDVSLQPQQQKDLAAKAKEFETNLAAVNNQLATLPQIDVATASIAQLAAATDTLTKKFINFNFGQPEAQKAAGSWSSAWARGTDRIPAMLSKGEFVVRETMAKKYWSQLMMINSGTAPLYRAQGGPVEHVTGFNRFDGASFGNNNVDVGGINVTLTSSGDAKVDAKTLAIEINRLARRGELPRAYNRS